MKNAKYFSSINRDEVQDNESTPIDISEIIYICREFATLGYSIQYQIENILENGVEMCLRNGLVKQESLPHIKDFLIKIKDNYYFGDAATQAVDCIEQISRFEKNKNINLN
ncbi:MAG: hypothetical protein LC122_12440 [Chitinophagales bacterium]|nr:hypothetical protein [Chitinophagales bacterium]